MDATKRISQGENGTNILVAKGALCWIGRGPGLRWGQQKCAFETKADVKLREGASIRTLN